MATKVIMPKQGLQMTEGTITRWIVKEGEMVEIEKPLFEMETDKLNIEISSPASGTLLKIVRREGETVPITEIIAMIGDPEEDVSGLFMGETETRKPVETAKVYDSASLEQASPEHDEPGKGKISEERLLITPRARKSASQKGINPSDIEGTGPKGLIIERDVNAYINKGILSPKATPLAKKFASLKEVDLSEIEGTGANGKIIRADIEKAAAAIKGKAGSRGERIIPFAGMRKVISDRMMQSLHGMAQANHRIKLDMTEVIRLREKLKEDGIKVSFTDLLIKIVARALLDFPIVNSSFTEKGILLKEYVNIGIAVAIENGLIVPVIGNADILTLKEVSRLSAELIEKAKSGKLKPDEYSRGTFTITNLGMFGIDEFTAIINPPESAILAVGKIDRVPVAEGESIVIKPVMVLSLTYDHRVIDGAPAAQFLQRIKQIMLNPYLLI